MNPDYILARRALQDLVVSDYECIFIDDYPVRVKGVEEIYSPLYGGSYTIFLDSEYLKMPSCYLTSLLTTL